jgi:hypothetical protein
MLSMPGGYEARKALRVRQKPNRHRKAPEIKKSQARVD